jgi:hypothetical protein
MQMSKLVGRLRKDVKENDFFLSILQNFLDDNDDSGRGERIEQESESKRAEQRSS